MGNQPFNERCEECGTFRDSRVVHVGHPPEGYRPGQQVYAQQPYACAPMQYPSPGYMAQPGYPPQQGWGQQGYSYQQGGSGMSTGMAMAGAGVAGLAAGFVAAEVIDEIF